MVNQIGTLILVRELNAKDATAKAERRIQRTIRPDDV